jgi:hypothetical protein
MDMTTLPAKQYTRQSLPDPIVVLIYTLVIGALLFFVAYTSTFHTSTGGAFHAPSMVSISSTSEASFAQDLQYWDANCSDGRASGSACNMIIARAQSCEISSASRYCSQYKTYMHHFPTR